MKTKTIFLSTLLSILATVGSQAQNTTSFAGNLYFAGYVYTEDTVSGKQTMIPFATIRFYEMNDPGKIIATRISNLSGGYTLRGFNPDSTYIIKVSAPGLDEQSFIRHPNNGRVKSGNISTHTRITTGKEYRNPVEERVYSPDDFIGGEEELTVMGMVEQLPGLEVYYDEVITKGDGSVRIMINGANVEASVFKELKDFPAAEVVKSMHYYDLSGFENSAYDGVLNIRLTIGDEAVAPTYKLASLEPYKQ